MDKLAGNLALSGEYFLTSHWGASARLNWLASSTETYSVKYHDEKWNVENGRILVYEVMAKSLKVI